MGKTLTRTFPTMSPATALVDLASRPLLAPNYVNFLKSICVSPPSSRFEGWDSYDVWVSYRSLLNVTGVVKHRVDTVADRIFVRHDGPIAAFEAVFCIVDGSVDLHCTYRAKVPLVSWLIAKSLDRLLSQVALAMDRYASSVAASPT